ncbi:hypothetical protein TanjilG_21300 [Lupinus angustifolius]|uniref:Uncharacterized protein n=1 Tax=Lupinus angustifolius TaxID=3871 RepID=A0A4P1RN49_LUPAN|nr:PREDICTED: protein ODORANT1-like [Lupinus angustifolius]OIW14160.1 hypothetical protein TanjilG_21300 [Lupinus angustifolius]
MGRQPCCDKVGLKKGPWTADEDMKLINFILTNGQCCWRAVPKLAGLLRCGKSCRLRWTNYLRPDLKRGLLSEEEEKMVIELHAKLGNRWSKIASHLPGRTDNEIKNQWNTHIKKNLKKMGIDPITHKPISNANDQTQTQPEQQTQQPLKEQHQQQSSTESSTIIDAIEEDKTITPLFDSMEIMNEFCIDEVPIIEPNKILVPYAPSTSTSTTSSSSSNSTNFIEDFLLQDFELSHKHNENDIINSIDNNNSSMALWDEDFMRSWDLLIKDDDDDSRKQVFDCSLSQYQRIVMDSESWDYGLF